VFFQVDKFDHIFCLWLGIYSFTSMCLQEVDRRRPGIVDAETLFMFQCSEGDALKRVVAVCAKAVFQPKYQMWASCEWSEYNLGAATSAELQFPFDVEYVACPCRLTGSGNVLAVRTSHQLAQTLVVLGKVWSAVELQYIIPPCDSLKYSQVMGTLGAPIMISGPDVPKSRKRVAEPKDDIMEALRKRPRLDALMAGRYAAHSMPRGPAGGHPRGAGGGGLAVEDGPVDDECFDAEDQFPSDVNILAEVLDFHIEEVGMDDQAAANPSVASSSAASSSNEPRPVVDPEPPPFDEEPPAPLPPGHDIFGPSASGYFSRNGRSIGRLTAVFNNSRGVRCYMHANCSVPFSLARCPEIAVIIGWLDSADASLPTDSKAAKDAKRVAHMAALKALARIV
jgi:hypothetical protein